MEPREIKPEDVRVGDSILVVWTDAGVALSAELMVNWTDGISAMAKAQGDRVAGAKLAGRTITLLDRPGPTPGQVMHDALGLWDWGEIGGTFQQRYEDAYAAVIAHYEATKPPAKGNAEAVKAAIHSAAPYAAFDYQAIADAALTPETEG